MIRIHLTLFILAVLFTGCKPKKQLTQFKKVPVPNGFANRDVTHSTAFHSLSWENILNDTILKGFIAEALQHNLELAQSKQDVMKVYAHLRHNKGLNKPFVSARVASGVTRYGFFTEAGAGNYDANFSPFLNDDQFMARDLRDFYGGFQASWEIDIWGKLKSKKQAAAHRYLASQEGYQWAETQVVTAVAIAYIRWKTQLLELKFLDSTSMIQERACEFARQRKTAGLSNELAINQLEAQMLFYRAIRQTKEQEINESENTLNQLLGRFPTGLPIAVHDEMTVTKPINQLLTPLALLDRRPDVRQAALELSASGADLHAARMALYPEIKIDALLGFQTFNASKFFDPQSMTYQLFGGLMGPVINRSAYKAQITYTEAQQQQAYAHYHATVLKAYYETLKQVQRIENLKALINLKIKEVDISERAFQNAIDLFESGRVTFVEVFIAQKEMLNAKLELIDIQRQFQEAEIYLYQALGGG
jgi:multidrug efflux system outer membrane protein